MIKPLRDILVCIPDEPVGRVGALYMPDNSLQCLRTHRRMVILFSGPKAREQGCEAGVKIHASESWGEEFMHNGKKVWIGRSRDINGIIGHCLSLNFAYCKDHV